MTTTECEPEHSLSDIERRRIETPVSALLGRLYLEQGHLEDAEAVFRTVLSQDGSDRAASEGLEAVRRARTDSSVSPLDDPAERDRSGGPTGLRPPASERIRRLRSWLGEVRAARRRWEEEG